MIIIFFQHFWHLSQFFPVLSSFFQFCPDKTGRNRFLPLFSGCPGRNRFLPEETQPCTADTPDQYWPDDVTKTNSKNLFTLEFCYWIPILCRSFTLLMRTWYFGVWLYSWNGISRTKPCLPTVYLFSLLTSQKVKNMKSLECCQTVEYTKHTQMRNTSKFWCMVLWKETGHLTIFSYSLTSSSNLSGSTWIPRSLLAQLYLIPPDHHGDPVITPLASKHACNHCSIMEFLSAIPMILLKMWCIPGLLSLLCHVYKEFWWFVCLQWGPGKH